ncbi:MAG: hypothetical protein H8E08_00365 [Candidatus Marinimicrobia bacterium]|nr:hypothetical protein [Candidatus Neomarinimicrobiota bacterium]
MLKVNNYRSIIEFTSLILLISTGEILFAQADPVTGYTPRLLTRSKLWGTFRNNGLQGGGNTPTHQSHDQTTLEYPGNAGRGEDFMKYWLDVEAYINGDPNLIDVSRVCNPQNARGTGLWVLSIADNDTMVSYSGPRDVTYDVDANRYTISGSVEEGLGNAIWPNSERSNYSPDHNTIQGNEPIEIHNYTHGKYIPNDEFPEEIILSEWENKMGLTVTRKAYAWSYPDFDDFILEEIIYENTGSKNLTDTYFAFMNSFSVSSAGHQQVSGHGVGSGDWRYDADSAQDDWFLYTGAPNYVSDNPESTAVYKNLEFCYQRDDDWVGTSHDDTGQPFVSTFAEYRYNEFQGQIENQLMGYQYIGFGPIDLFPPFVNDPDEEYVSPESVNQPYTFKLWKNGNNYQYDYEEPNQSRHLDTEMYNMIIDTTGGAINENPNLSTLVTHAYVIGPYSIAPGEKAKIVFAFAAGSGADWHNKDEFKWSIEPTAKFELKDGEHSIIRNFRKAQFMYNMGFDVPDPPPDVAVTFKNSQAGNVIISWDAQADTARDPDYSGDEAYDVEGYRVYRSWPPSFDWHYGPWEFVVDIPLKEENYYDFSTGKYTFVDEKSFAGYNYYYSIRTYDSGHEHWIDKYGIDHGPVPSLESGYASPEQKNMIAETPFQPSSPLYDQMTEQIRVVPNPFRLDFNDPAHMYPDVADPYKIRFINLPKICMIKIYSASGDLVYEKKHFKQTAAETSWRQNTISFSGRVVSGIYFWVVESLDPASYGKVQKGTLAIVK